jgi:hypothetical protein
LSTSEARFRPFPQVTAGGPKVPFRQVRVLPGAPPSNSSSRALSRNGSWQQLRLAIRGGICVPPLDILNVEEPPSPDTCRTEGIRLGGFMHPLVGTAIGASDRHPRRSMGRRRKPASLWQRSSPKTGLRRWLRSQSLSRRHSKSVSTQRNAQISAAGPIHVWRSARRTRPRADGRRPIATAPHRGPLKRSAAKRQSGSSTR